MSTRAMQKFIPSDSSPHHSNVLLVPKVNSSNYRILRSLGLLLVSGGLLSAIYLTIQTPRSHDQQIQTVQIERRSLPITISANGSVKPERSINISPQTSGVLKRLLVTEGDRVTAGQVIAYMDDSNLQGQITQAEGHLDSASSNLQKLLAGNRPEEIAEAQARLDEALASLKEAELTLQQDQTLYAAGALSRRELASSEAKQTAAAAQVTQAQQSLGVQKAGARSEDIAAARAEVVAAQGSVNQIQAELDDTVIRAPFSGTVIRKYADPGAFVAPTTAASAENSATSSSILALATQNRIVANVPETSIGRLQVGQTAVIKADAFPGKTFEGAITEIAPQSTVEQNVTSFEVKVSLIDPTGMMRSGMNVTVEFQVGKLNSAVMVPTVAIVRQESGTGVYVQTADQKIVFQSIETGVTLGNETEAQKGLQGNERVLISFPDAKPQNLPFFSPPSGDNQ